MSEPQTIEEAIRQIQDVVDWLELRADDNTDSAIALEFLERAVDKLASALPSADR